MSKDALLAHCLELLSSAGQARARRMFGGQGIYVDDLFIALIAFDRLYLKADEVSRARFEAAGSQPFSYAKKGGDTVVMSYWSAPDEAMDSPDAMAPWARMAVAAALRARKVPTRPAAGKRQVPAKRP